MRDTSHPIEAVLHNQIQRIMSSCDDGQPLTSETMECLEARCIACIRAVFSLDWASLERPRGGLDTNPRKEAVAPPERMLDPYQDELADRTTPSLEDTVDAYPQELGARSPEHVVVESLPSIESIPSPGPTEDEQQNPPASESSRSVAAEMPPSDYNHVSSAEYPNGDVEFSHTVNPSDSALESRSNGWAMIVYSTKQNKAGKTYYKSCLGVYQCPKSDCTYVERPRVPRNGKSRFSDPLPPKQPCPFHGLALKHLACTATLKVTQGDSDISFIHRGLHDHPYPCPIRPLEKRRAGVPAEARPSLKQPNSKRRRIHGSSTA
ncbi:hypothetical protein EDD21DRAFT_420735 [Dissophora ornata]|nr:hypothetical protein EDD21DRAFT_420735 [Dissophora ornata]